MDDKFLEILPKIGDVFMRFGVRSVNMDDIAREVKMSKKTLYKYVTDKSDLVFKVMSSLCDQEKCDIQEAIEESENAIDELILVSKKISQKLGQIHPSIRYDMEKYYPETWSGWLEHKDGFILDSIKTNIERGIKEKLYRKNLHPEIIAKLYNEKVEILFDPAVFPVGQYTFQQVHTELVRYHIRGIANDDGLKYLQERMKKETTQY